VYVFPPSAQIFAVCDLFQIPGKRLRISHQLDLLRLTVGLSDLSYATLKQAGIENALWRVKICVFVDKIKEHYGKAENDEKKG